MTAAAAPDGAEPLALIFKLNNGLVARSLEGLTDDELWQQPAGSGNPIGWVLGHLTESRVHLLGRLGEPMDTGWDRLFARGSALRTASDYPARPALEQAWSATHARMRDAFARLTASRLAEAPAGPPMPGATTVAGLIAFYAFHESYHVGQLGYIRKLLGRSALAD